MSTMRVEQQETHSTPIPCPELETWQNYAAGLLDEAQSAVLDAHLESCAACNQTLQLVENTDSDSESQVVEQVIQAAKTGKLQWDLVQNFQENSLGGTGITGQVSAADEDRNGTSRVEVNTTVSVIGPYRLIRPLASGGMGRVYLAEHVKLRRPVALKLLPLSMAPAGAVERFEREIQAIGKLSHPAIV